LVWSGFLSQKIRVCVNLMTTSRELLRVEIYDQIHPGYDEYLIGMQNLLGHVRVNVSFMALNLIDVHRG